MSFIERYYEMMGDENFLPPTMLCIGCGEEVRDKFGKNKNGLLIYELDEISISYYKGDQIGHLYFHPSCFEEIAGLDYFQKLLDDVK